MKKALILTSVASMIEQFNMNNIRELQNLEYEVTVATNFLEPGNIPLEKSLKLQDLFKKKNVKVINLEFSRAPLNSNNLKVYKRIKKLLKNGDYDLIHCQSPIGGVLTRLAVANSRRKLGHIVYTAHGFHFFKGAALINWFIYYPIERYLAKYTDTLITINKEDYKRAMHFNSGKILYIPGIGVDLEKIRSVAVNKIEKKIGLGLPESSFIILSVGEVNKNKNHEVIIRALANLMNDNIHYVICGKGPLENKLMKLSQELKVSKKIHFLGFRDDVQEIYKIADVFAFPSKREGLGIAAIEAMASGLPILTSNVHGINDYSINGSTGYSYDPKDTDGFANGISRLYSDYHIREFMGKNNKKIVEKFSSNNVNKVMREIYKQSI
ncbi:glycosyltransferase family 4 protein [Ruoffia sp. FAM 26255]|uniref:glycosyltransferase family 4 protein n=1 Tax=Ruoffia sp. FAM 26255 TaxID=3259519 RepID=UPI003885C4BF